MRLLIALLLMLAPLGLATRAGAQASPMAFRTEVYTMGAWWIIAEGTITPDTATRFDQFIAAQGRTDYLQGVRLNSPGGSLEAGLALGRSIRRLRIATAVDGDAQCLSACAYAFLGGLNRRVEAPENAEESTDPNQRRLGFHSFYYDPGRTGGLSPSDTALLSGRLSQDVQDQTSRLSDYVASMGASTDIVVRSSRTPRNQFLFFTRAELLSLRAVTNYGADITDFQLVPDGATLMAVARHQSHQFIIACRQEAGRRVPIVVFSQAVAATRGQIATEIPTPIRLSTILALPAMPWTARDLEHRHFHAHGVFTGVDFNPVFGFFGMIGREDAGESVTLDRTNAEFRSGGGFSMASSGSRRNWRPI